MTRRAFFIIALFMAMSPLMVNAQQPVIIEYFLDSDPGHGLAHTIKDIHIGSNQLTFDVSDASAGAHVLYVRSQDSDGQWSTTMSRPLYIEQLQDIAYVEYYIDTDPGQGMGTPVALPQQEYKAHLQLELALDISSLSLGEHELAVRAYDVFGQWSDILSRHFTIVEKEEPEFGDLSRIEYFFDTDPGYGLGYPLKKANTGEHTYQMSFANLEAGFHLLCLRAQYKADDAYQWSSTLSRPIYVVNSSSNIVAMEYYFDDEPGEGNGVAVEIPADISEPFAFQVDVNELSLGFHEFYVRVKDSNGKWSVLQSTTIEVIVPTGIDNIATDELQKDVYDLQGRQFAQPQRGVNIIRTFDGKKRKVLVK